MGSKEGRTEAPTQKRKRDQRRKGQVAKSADLGSWLGLLVGSYLLPSAVGRLFDAAGDSLQALPAITQAPDGDVAIAALGRTLTSGFLAIAPFLLIMGGVGIAAQLMQTGFLVSPKLLKPDFKRVNPMQGIKKLVSPRSFVDTLKQLAKVAAIGWVAWPYVQRVSEELTSRGRIPLLAGLAMSGQALIGMVRATAWAVLAISGADYGYQRFQHRRDMRMTKQEIRDEMRQSEGDPHVKGRIRSLQLALARQRMMGDVPLADVVITNPTHVAVALRYDPTRGAPRVIAVGVGETAGRIRARAIAAGVPLVEAKPLARALWRACDVGDEIPTALYEAVAKVLAFVRRLRGSISSSSSLSLPPAYVLDHQALEAIPARRRRRRLG
ncbi:MAG: flagellar biosynthesis protein FlhB [Acidimicrobiia bacterium]